MIRTTPPKVTDSRIFIPTPKKRGVMPPPTRVRAGRRRHDRRGNNRSQKWV